MLRGKKLRKLIGSLPVATACDLLDHVALLHDPDNQRVDFDKDTSLYYHPLNLERAREFQERILAEGITVDPLGVITYDLRGQRYNVFPGQDAAALSMACLSTQLQAPVVSRGRWLCVPEEFTLGVENNAFVVRDRRGGYRGTIHGERLAAIYLKLGVRAR